MTTCNTANAKADKPRAEDTRVVAKLCGADIELGNFILGLERSGGTGHEASRALLAEIRGIPNTGYSSSQGSSWFSSSSWHNAADDSNDSWSQYGYHSYNCQDWGRKFLADNGGCIYIDLNHLEVCLPECRCAFDHLAAWHAMLLIVREALDRANARLPKGQKIQVLINNSDGQGNSYGSHLDFLITRRCYNEMFQRKLHHMLYLAAYQASSIIFTGAGKVGSENGLPEVDFQLSQRADFFETLTGTQTTHNRPLVNLRDESLCGSLGETTLQYNNQQQLARLHVIFFDNTLCHVSSLLKVGVTQIILAMIEQGCIQPQLLLDDPLLAVLLWSRDPKLKAKCRLASGKHYTALEVQLAMADLAGRFIANNRAEGIVPRAREIFDLWTETLDQLKRRDTQALQSKLDWVLKRSIIEQAMQGHDLTWSSPQVRFLDQMYANLDSGEGLYWQMERAGIVNRLVNSGRIEHFVHQPPTDTRAYTRAMVLRSVKAEQVAGLDWDSLRLQQKRKGGGYWSSSSYFDMPMHDPLRFGKADFDCAMSQSANLAEALSLMGMKPTTYFGQPLLISDQPGASLLPVLIAGAATNGQQNATEAPASTNQLQNDGKECDGNSAQTHSDE